MALCNINRAVQMNVDGWRDKICCSSEIMWRFGWCCIKYCMNGYLFCVVNLHSGPFDVGVWRRHAFRITSFVSPFGFISRRHWTLGWKLTSSHEPIRHTGLKLVAWHSGRTSVFGRRTFPIAQTTFSWWVTIYAGKPPAGGQSTRSTQLFIL